MEQLEVKQKQKLGKERDLSFDVMNILACISVIALHHNALVHSFISTLGWAQSLVVECVCYFAVPVFLMISGANLLDYRDKYDTGTFFKKRIVRTVIPWLIWSMILLFWKLKTGQMQLHPPVFRSALDQIFNYKVESVYWYFGALFACYLAIPVFSLLRRERKTLWYVVLLNFIFLSCLPVLGVWLKFSWSLDVPVVGSMIIFVLLGYLLSSQELSRKQRIWLYALGVGCMLFRYVYTYHFSYLSGITDTSIKGYGRFHGVLYSAAVFVCLRRVPWGRILPGWLQKQIPRLSSYSFGVYLIHRVVMYYEMQVLHTTMYDLSWRTVCILLTYGISLLLVAGIKKIPLIKYIVG